jgi:hypothetical protein
MIEVKSEAPAKPEETASASSDEVQSEADEMVADTKQKQGRATKSIKKRDKPVSQAVKLARVFSAQKAGVIKCFKESELELSETSLSVRVELDVNGRVKMAKVFPDNMGNTPTGKCIVQATKAIEFGPQKEPISFRVPLTARRGR